MYRDIKSPIRYLKGVGPKKAEILARLGIQTVEDILYYLPRRYEDRTKFANIRNIKIGEYYSIKAKVLASGLYRTKKGVPVFQLAVGDGTGILYCVWYNMPFLKKNFRQGQNIIVYGKAERYDKLQMNHPDYELIDNQTPSINMGKIVPVYSLTQDLTQKYIRALLHEAIERYKTSIFETLPPYIREKEGLAGIGFSLNNIHFPETFENLSLSYRRLVFEEFFILQTALAMKKFKAKNTPHGLKFIAEESMLDKYKAMLPFELTEGQLRAVKDIERDMTSGKVMNRLLEGDVGSGKTVVAVYALILAVNNGYQGAIMAPTEILARQHYIVISELLMPLGINVRLLISGIDGVKKNAIREEIKSGDSDIVVGTHALIQEDVAFKNLGLVVIDEQHKFGVNQRDGLRSKGDSPHVLVMTATPIPRTLALTVYGDLDISVIKEIPKERKPVTTLLLTDAKRGSAYEFVSEEVKKGRQAYIVCPRLEKTEDESVKSAVLVYENLRKEVFPDLRLALIHGRMDSREKEIIMKDFKANKYDILVSTVVIEVGIDVHNATVMLIENAERFGLAQLHQLRGRIGRGPCDSYCLMIGEPSNEESARRLSKMMETQDGFEIAEEDLSLRGPGEFFGTRQHGLPELRFGNLIKDFEIMERARDLAFEVVAGDPKLELPKNAVIRETVEKRFDSPRSMVHSP